MNSKDYWEHRAARDMYEQMETAEEAAKQLTGIYERTAEYFNTKSKGIFGAFVNQTGLTEEEARALIKAAPSYDIPGLMMAVNTITDLAKKKQVLEWLKAAATQARLYRLFEIQREIDEIMPLLFAAQKSINDECYKRIIADSYLHKLFDIQQEAGIGRKINPLTIEKIEKLIRKPWYGGDYSQRLWVNTQEVASAVKSELIVSYLTGKPEYESWQAIDKEFKKGANAAHRLIRTESSYMANMAQLEAYKEAGIDKYIFTATLDLKTSEVCRNQDRKTYYVKDAMPGLNYPPMHPWCRSTTRAWIPDEMLEKLKRTARDPKTGKNIKVPANMTYREWYEKFVQGAENESKSN